MTLFGYDREDSGVLLGVAIAFGFLIGMVSVENFLPFLMEQFSGGSQTILIDRFSCRPLRGS